jgi:hypothetical protein
VDCCEGGRFEGRHALPAYWTLKLLETDLSALEIEAIVPEIGGVYLEHRACGGRVFRTRFRFNGDGKIAQTTCGPLVGKGDALAA